MSADLEFLRELCTTPGVSGFEAPVQEVVRTRLAGVAAPQTDVLGSVHATVNGGGRPHLVVAGHADQIGLQLTHVDDDGFLFFDKIGGIDPLLIPGRHFIVHGRQGAVHGVGGKRPTHIIPLDERGTAPPLVDQWIDIGASGRDAALERVAIGDSVTFVPDFLELSPGIVTSQALDNRVGVYVAVRALEHYAARGAAASVTALSTVQEETRYMGALVQRRRLDADCVVVVDGDFCSDQPEVDARHVGGEVKLGGGPVLARGGATNQPLLDLALEVAAGEGIAVQVKAYPGDTKTDMEALQASGEGVAGLNVGIPMRYMHSPHEVAHLDDLEASALLIAALAVRLGELGDGFSFIPRP